MDRPSPFPPMTAADAHSLGFATFNDCPHQTVDIPDGGFTLTTRSSDGKRTTFYFGVSADGGSASFIDIQYHDAGADVANSDCRKSAVFDMIIIAKGGRIRFDSRKLAIEAKPSIAVILLEPATVPSPATAPS